MCSAHMNEVRHGVVGAKDKLEGNVSPETGFGRFVAHLHVSGHRLQEGGAEGRGLAGDGY